MNFLMTLLVSGMLASLPVTVPAHAPETHAPDNAHNAHEDHAHPGENHDDEHDHDAEVVELSARQRSLAGIRTETLTARPADYALYAPAELRSNDYTSYLVSPRVPSVVVRRHVALGEQVHVGQPLVTLFSEHVASAQADYRVARSEQQRVQKLGRAAVGEQRFVAAESTLATARARLLAYGLDDDALQQLIRDELPAGEYTLTARRAGTVLADDFRQGQLAEAGTPLMELADESTLWAAAYLPPDSPAQLPSGLPAEIKVGPITQPGTVLQQAHTIDPVTRTRVVHLAIDNREHLLHPGQFAEVRFLFRTETAVLTVPETALLRHADGTWQVFVEDSPGHYRARAVTRGRAFGSLREVSDIEPGTTVVTQGAFFVASQIAKGGFDPHNH